MKFKNKEKMYKISHADIMEYNREKRGKRYKYLLEREMDINEMIERIMFQNDDLLFDREWGEDNLEYLTYELSRQLDMPINIARRQVLNYMNNRDIIFKNKRKGNGNNVFDLVKAISEYVTHRIIYLPTYRRIEDDFASLNLRSEELNKAELLIRFGMSDVQMSIDRILEKIRSLAMKGFTEMTGVLLKQYVDGESPLEEKSYSK